MMRSFAEYYRSFDEVSRVATAANLAAIRGEAVPSVPFACKWRVTLRCLVRGIRHHDGFAQELHGCPELPEVTRALNARAIMSNRVPEMTRPEEFPYCFWYPDVPGEDTLRELLRKYPNNTLLSYQVGRTCAVGGYTRLYHELNLLPDVAMAEEARDNGHSEIYEAVMNTVIRYSYMDDYNCRLRETPIAGACLNGDTCVRSTLAKSLPMATYVFDNRGPPPFDITEDQCIDTEGIMPDARPVDPEAIRLLHTPLPADLTTVDKDLLILMAAWGGNIDRYSRLRRPEMLRVEQFCVMRGIYHYPLFAKWWLTQFNEESEIYIRQAVYARCTMNNDLSWLNDSLPETHMPKMIWHPQCADQTTYLELARRRPSLAALAARACMHAGYQEAFDKINWQPTKCLWTEARRATNTHYRERVEHKAQEMGFDCDKQFSSSCSSEDDDDDDDDAIIVSMPWHEMGCMALLAQEWPPRVNGGTHSWLLCRDITIEHVVYEDREGETIWSMAGQVLLNACIADPSMRPTIPGTELDLRELYQRAVTGKLGEGPRKG